MQKQLQRKRQAVTDTIVSGESLQRDLLLIASDRDKEAFRRVFMHFAPRLKSFLLVGGFSPQRSEEVMQETMITVWRKAHLYNPAKARPSTWIFTIARNLKIDRQRRSTRMVVEMDDPSQQPEAEPDGEALMTLKEEKARVQNAIESLTPQQREVIQMCFYKDLTHSEAAEMLEIPLGTVKSRIRLAIAKIKAALEDAP